MPPILDLPESHLPAQNLLDFIDASPSPWHVGSTLASVLEANGFQCLQENQSWTLVPNGKYYLLRGGSSLIAFSFGTDPLPQSGFRILGAHTDSPGLRLKPRAPHSADPMIRLGVEVYGGPILATFTDRDLGIAGRVYIRGNDGPKPQLLRVEKPIARLPNLAIHMNRGVNEDGLKLNKQTELPVLWSLLQDALPPNAQFKQFLAERLAVASADIINWELALYDTQPGAFWGPQQEFIADSQIDNLASCHAGLSALLATKDPRATCMVAFFDHEEIGSESAKGAGGSFLADVLSRILSSAGTETKAQTFANSFFISADMAHAYQPNFPSAYEPEHKLKVNAGPVIKTNANQRYATDAESEAYFIALCEQADVPWQQYSHRTDLGCGSTIGPIISARLGIKAVDVGNPMWAMHSARESAGTLDHGMMIKVLKQFFAN